MDIEENLIRSAANGDHEAFKEIVLKYQGFVFAICLNVLKDRHEAENAAQETFIKLYHSLNQYEYKGFKTWLGRIALNKSIDIFRKKKSSHVVEVSFIEDASYDECQLENSPEDDLVKKEDIKRVLKLCSELPESYKRVIEMYYILEMSYQSIAESEGVSLRTVESRLYRGKKMIREKWEVEGKNEPL